MPRSETIAVGIPTAGRAAILCETLRELRGQARPPDMVFICGTKLADMEGADQAFPGVHLLLTDDPGLTRQRNTIIVAARRADILIFFDDDFLAEAGYIDAIHRAMAAFPGIVVATGVVLADGILGPGLVPNEARLILAKSSGCKVMSVQTRQVFTGYGCNMAVRLEPMRQNSILFDPRLPLYGWQEDVDLSRRMAVFGDVVEVSCARGVHLGVKSGRSSGVRLGYSQVANPLYLSGKRSGYPYRRAIAHIARNMAKNIVKWPRPEPYVDRRGRLQGNLMALYDLLQGRMVPERILKL